MPRFNATGPLRTIAVVATFTVAAMTVHGVAATRGASGIRAGSVSPVLVSASPTTTVTTAPSPTTTPTATTEATPPPAAPAPQQAAPTSTPPAPTVAVPAVTGQEASLSIPSLGLGQAVVPGGQQTIDRGVVTHYSGPGWRPPVAAGAPGTYWLAAHHATHGAPFAALPNIKVGALILIDTVGQPEIRYQVTSIETVGTTASYSTVYGPDSTTSRILLQTCEGDAYRMLVHGIRVN